MKGVFGNAPICASAVLECSCCRIHRNVAAPTNSGVEYTRPVIKVDWLAAGVLFVPKQRRIGQ